MSLTIGTTRRALAIGLIGAAVAAPTVLARDSYNVTAEGRVAKTTKITRTSARLNGWVQNPAGQKSRLVFTIGTSARKLTRTIPAGKWSTSRLPRKVTVVVKGLRPGTRYFAQARVQAYVLAKKGRSKYRIASRPAGRFTFTTKG